MASCEQQSMEIWQAFLRAKAAIHRAIHHNLREHGLSGSQFALLQVLADMGPEGAKLNEISQRLNVTCGNVTGLVDRLEEAGLIARVAHPEDRRITLAVLSPAGRILLDELYPGHVARVRKLMSALTREERGTLAALLDRITAKAEEMKE